MDDKGHDLVGDALKESESAEEIILAFTALIDMAVDKVGSIKNLEWFAMMKTKLKDSQSKWMDDFYHIQKGVCKNVKNHFQ